MGKLWLPLETHLVILLTAHVMPTRHFLVMSLLWKWHVREMGNGPMRSQNALVMNLPPSFPANLIILCITSLYNFAFGCYVWKRLLWKAFSDGSPSIILFITGYGIVHPFFKFPLRSFFIWATAITCSLCVLLTLLLPERTLTNILKLDLGTADVNQLPLLISYVASHHWFRIGC